MSHQPFEGWLLDRDEIPAGKLSQLETHLADCTSCRQLESSLRQVDQLLVSTPSVEPPDGFLQRFAIGLGRAREQRRRRRTALVLGLTMAGSLSVLAALLVLGAPELAGAVNGLLHGFVKSWRQLAVLVEFAASLIQSLDATRFPVVLLWPGLALAVGALGTYTVLSVVWTALYLRLATQPIRWSRRQ